MPDLVYVDVVIFVWLDLSHYGLDGFDDGVEFLGADVLNGAKEVADMGAAAVLYGHLSKGHQKANSFSILEDKFTDKAVDETDEIAACIV